jgi:hypothetical protein
MSRKIEEFILALDTPYEQLSVDEAFEHLTKKERKYLHHYTKAGSSLSDVSKKCFVIVCFLLGLLVWLVDFGCPIVP